MINSFCDVLNLWLYNKQIFKIKNCTKKVQRLFLLSSFKQTMIRKKQLKHFTTFKFSFISLNHPHTKTHFAILSSNPSISPLAQKPTLSVLCQLNYRVLTMHREHQFVFTPFLICFLLTSLCSYACEVKGSLLCCSQKAAYFCIST